ncbi:MAG: hypothetical protein IPP72_01505 [Chitinophagaceae bacterium]|nr:hypothetical protein [Chitinophagaceae bacterium]
MEPFLFISPAVVAILVFIYMRKEQAKRNEKLRKRFWKQEKELMQILSANEDKQNLNEDDN